MPESSRRSNACTADSRARMIEASLGRLANVPRLASYGRVVRITGLVIEAAGLDVGVGELCRITSLTDGRGVLAEVVRLSRSRRAADAARRTGGRASRGDGHTSKSGPSASTSAQDCLAAC